LSLSRFKTAHEDAYTTSCPSGEKATALTNEEWPSNVLPHAPQSASFIYSILTIPSTWIGPKCSRRRTKPVLADRTGDERVARSWSVAIREGDDISTDEESPYRRRMSARMAEGALLLECLLTVS
jgi:hypothetical protein